jgi:hypothetical protein
MKPSLCAALVALAVVLPAARGQVNEADLKEDLAATTERGHALYDYDQAAWHGTDAIFALHPDMSNAAQYICTRTTKGWRVVFPRWNATHNRLTVAYEAAETAPGQYKAHKVDPPEDAGDDLLAKERALELVASDFRHSDRPYNSAILHGPNGAWYVYFYPGQTKDTVWPIGGDVRYTVSPDGSKIVEKRQLHKSILDQDLDPAKKPQSGFHTHVLSDVPEDTDVFYVLNRRPRIPEWVGTTGGWFFVIQTDGSISSTPPCAKGNPLPCKKR